jgi:hypothetical protein
MIFLQLDLEALFSVIEINLLKVPKSLLLELEKIVAGYSNNLFQD